MRSTRGSEAEIAWAALSFAVVCYEVWAPKGQLLSEGMDRALERHPVLTRAVVAAVALHLVNAIPARLDPISMLGRGFKG